jgi:hypothetical protein
MGSAYRAARTGEENMAKQIEITATAGYAEFEVGQMLTVTRETACFVFAKSEAGREYKVSKQTSRIRGYHMTFFPNNRQASVDLDPEISEWLPCESDPTAAKKDAALFA